jgi:hypothetical protein
MGHPCPSKRVNTTATEQRRAGCGGRAAPGGWRSTTRAQSPGSARSSRTRSRSGHPREHRVVTGVLPAHLFHHAHRPLLHLRRFQQSLECAYLSLGGPDRSCGIQLGGIASPTSPSVLSRRVIGRVGTALGVFNPSAKGYLLITWQPEELSPCALAALDVVIALGSPNSASQLVDLTAAVARHASRPYRPAPRRADRPRRGGVASAPPPGDGVHLGTPDHPSSSPRAQVQPDRCRTRSPVLFPGRARHLDWAIAGNLGELETQLVRCDRECCATTAPRRDFPAVSPASSTKSRLLPTSLQRRTGCRPTAPAAVVEEVRLVLIAALHARHPR